MSWPLVKLESIFEIARGGSPRPIAKFITDDLDGLNWISIKDASNSDKYITKTKQKIKREGLAKSRLVNSGDFLLTNSMSFGRPYIMKTTGCIHDGWLVLSGNKEKVDQDYFYHLFGSELLHNKFSQLAAGAVVKNLNISLVKSVKIPLPPLAEQQKIAAILDAADQLRQKDQQLIDHYTSLSQSLFLEMFGDPVTNPMGWDKSVANNYIELLTGFAFKSNDYSSNEKDIHLCGGLIITPTGINWGKANYWKRDELDNLDKYQIIEGDIVMAMDRPWISSGFKIHKITKSDKESLLVQRTARIRGKGINQDYLYFLYKHTAFERQASTTETTVPHISPKDIRKYELIIPPLELQNQFAQYIKKIEQQKQYAQASREQSETLFNSLLQRAFKGELT